MECHYGTGKSGGNTANAGGLAAEKVKRQDCPGAPDDGLAFAKKTEAGLEQPASVSSSRPHAAASHRIAVASADAVGEETQVRSVAGASAAATAGTVAAGTTAAAAAVTTSSGSTATATATTTAAVIGESGGRADSVIGGSGGRAGDVVGGSRRSGACGTRCADDVE
jgi:hypothetical protein